VKIVTHGPFGSAESDNRLIDNADTNTLTADKEQTYNLSVCPY
jgi:hypothetical protein